jgi:hypothetical protein
MAALEVSATTPVASSEKLDTMGASASALCAIHCALMPFVVTALPLIGLGFLAERWAEWAFLGVAATLATLSLCLGQREHRSRGPLAVASVGVVLLLCAQGGHHHVDDGHIHIEWSVMALKVLGGLTLAAAHLVNRRLCRACKSCAHEC